MQTKSPYVYIVTNKRYGTLYAGVTSNLAKRLYEHKNGLTTGFSKEHNLHCLVYYEAHHMMEFAIKREKQLKNWQRAWKIELIEEGNPHWFDLSENVFKM